MAYTDWFTFLMVDWLGNALLVLLVTSLILMVILKFGNISFEVIGIYLAIVWTYFITLLYPGKAGILIAITLSLVYVVWEALKDLNKPESGS